MFGDSWVHTTSNCFILPIKLNHPLTPWAHSLIFVWGRYTFSLGSFVPPWALDSLYNLETSISPSLKTDCHLIQVSFQEFVTQENKCSKSVVLDTKHRQVENSWLRKHDEGNYRGVQRCRSVGRTCPTCTKPCVVAHDRDLNTLKRQRQEDQKAKDDLHYTLRDLRPGQTNHQITNISYICVYTSMYVWACK